MARIDARRRFFVTEPEGISRLVRLGESMMILEPRRQVLKVTAIAVSSASVARLSVDMSAAVWIGRYAWKGR
jgi:hypothetical protein